MKAKFSVGAKVFLNGRTPNYLDVRRHRERTIVRRVYSAQAQACFYYLGANGHSSDITEFRYPCRSYQLHPISEMPKAGRPRVKRQYHFHNHKANSLKSRLSNGKSYETTDLALQVADFNATERGKTILDRDCS